jgi:hypothetical protein
MLGIAKLVGRRLIDRHRNRAGCGICAPTGVKKDGFGVT